MLTNPFISACILQSDCQENEVCYNVLDALTDFLDTTSHASELEFLKRKARIHGRECVVNTTNVFTCSNAGQYARRIASLFGVIKDILSNDLTGLPAFGLDLANLTLYIPNEQELQERMENYNCEQLRMPMTRQAG